MKILLIFCLLFSQLSFSEELPNGKLTPLKKGDTAPYEGIIADKKHMKYFRKINEQKKLLEEKSAKLEELGKLQKTSYEVCQTDLTNLNKDYKSLENKKYWSNIFYFVSGIVLTGGLVLATMKLTNRK